MGAFIRERQRCGRPREAFGQHVAWTEYQVVDGRKIRSRWDLREQAERALAALSHPEETER